MPPPVAKPDVAEPAPAVTVRSAEHLPIAAARDLLDWLEGHGIRAQEVIVEDDGTMTVRWSA
jgi:hypothetical protein